MQQVGIFDYFADKYRRNYDFDGPSKTTWQTWL